MKTGIKLAYLGYAFALAAALPMPLVAEDVAGETHLQAQDAKAIADPDAAAATQLQLLPFKVEINGRSYGDASLLKLPDGRLLASSSDFSRWRLLLPAVKPYKLGEDIYYPLDGCSGVAELFNDQQLARLRFDSRCFETSRISSRRVTMSKPQRSEGVGSFFNYDLVGTRQDQPVGSVNTLNGLFEAAAFNALGVLTSQWVGSNLNDAQSAGSLQGRTLRRIDTALTHDDPVGLNRLIIGDSVGGSGLFGRPLRLGGVRYARNFNLQPGFVSLPRPALAGETSLPSVLDIYVDGVRRQSQNLAPGPFEIDAVPTINGFGEVQVVVRDLLGREQVITESYFTSSRQLQRGLSDFSYEVGALRRNFGRRSNDYGALAAAGTHRYGFSNTLTAEARAELVSDRLQGLGGGAVWTIKPLGVLSAGLAVSHSVDGGGGLALLAIDRTVRGKLSIGGRIQLTSADFRQAGGSETVALPARLLNTNIRYSLPGFGGLGLSYFNVDNRARGADLSTVTGSFTTRLNHASLSILLTERIAPSTDHSASFRLTWPFGGRTLAASSYRINEDATGRVSGQATASLRSGTPRGEGWGYGAELRQSHGDGRAGQLDGSVSANTNISFGSFGVTAASNNDRAAYRATVAGGLGLLGGHAFASRKITNSFAVVETGTPDLLLTVYGQPAGRSDADGVAVLPYLQPYQDNRIEVDTSKLPMDIEIPQLNLVATPYFRSGLLLSLPSSSTRSAVMTVRQLDGKPVPAGAMLYLGAQSFPVGKMGLAYLRGVMPGDNTARAEWEGHRCTIRFNVPAGGGFQPDLGTLTCEESQP